MTDLSRRAAINGMVVGAAASAAGMAAATPAAAQPASAGIPPAFGGRHGVKPLTIDPAKLDGLSERLIRSHWENNYQGSVRTLNTTEGRLAAAAADKDTPPAVYGGLKREELHRTGSVILHELYFEQLGGNGMAGPGIRDALAGAYGTFDAWQAEFRLTALSLAGGSGWAILAWNRHTRSLHNYWAWDHTNGPLTGEPLLVLDMYEHAYHMDYGAAAAKYVDAFLRNVDWRVVEARYRAALS